MRMILEKGDKVAAIRMLMMLPMLIRQGRAAVCVDPTPPAGAQALSTRSRARLDLLTSRGVALTNKNKVGRTKWDGQHQDTHVQDATWIPACECRARPDLLTARGLALTNKNKVRARTKLPNSRCIDD
jgi:hypothetical protein